MHPIESNFMTFEPYCKGISRIQKTFPSYLMPTRSNTPDEISPDRISFDNSSDRDSFAESLTPPGRIMSGSSSLTSVDMSDPSLFEIDVRPKRRRFSNIQERIIFVEEYKRKYKTELCKNWELRGTCKFGDKCCFAHGRDELKNKSLTHLKYKTKPCKQYHQAGYCPYGQRCQYLHKEALMPNIFFQPLEEKALQSYYTYEMLHEINVICTTDSDLSSLFETLPQRPRLEVFSTMATCDA
jgi:hypothetical protein